MLSRKKKTRSWFKRKNEGLQLLAKITSAFAENPSLDEAFQQLGFLLSEHIHSREQGIYTYTSVNNRFSLRFADGAQNVFAKHPECSMTDIESCGMSPTVFGMFHVIDLPPEQASQVCFFRENADQAIQAIMFLPLFTHETMYGMILLASEHFHHLTEDDEHFFTVLTQYISLATERTLLTEQFEHEVALKMSQLHESERKYRAVFEDASEAIVLIDIDTQRFVEANRQAALLVGYLREELPAMTVNDFWVRKDEKPLSTRLLRSVIKRQSVTLHERQIRRKDRQILWIEVTASAVKYHGKEVVLAIVRDITQRKQLELERSVIATINQALVSSHDVRDVYNAVGQNLRKIFVFDWIDIFLPGSSSKTLRLFLSVNITKNVSNLEEREYSQEGTTIQAIFRTGTPEIVEYKDGEAHRLIPALLGKQLQSSLFFPLEYQDTIIGILHFGSYHRQSFSPQHFDFLRRIASQLAIAIENTLLFRKVDEERAVYKHLIENVKELVFQVDPRGKILFTNHRVFDILGYTPEEIIGTNFFSYVMSEDLETARAGFRLVRRHEQPLSGEYRVLHKNGTVLTISIYTRPIIEDGRAVGMQGIIQDITPPPDRFMTHRRGLHGLIGRSPRMQETYELIMSVAETDSTVLIHGESGTGKELIAQAIHAYSHRKNKPFIVVNCAAYSEHLLESELFGHERGAFTGAHRRKLGRFELAKGGTIFLDEVGEIPLHSQLLLLRVLQNKTFERVGGEKTLEADVRIVAATNRNLVEEMKAGRFREDLYYRLNVISIDVPSLRDRKEDIPALVDHFLKGYSASTGKQVLKCSQRTLEVLMDYDWAGNVRELENAIERAVVMASGNVLTPENLPAAVRQEEVIPLEGQQLEAAQEGSLYEYEKQLILKTLQATEWNKYQAAKLLGITRSTLYSKIEKYGLTPPD